MCTQSELDVITKMIAKIYRECYGEHLVSVYLYGSYARKDNDNESDIDMVAIVDETREKADETLKRVWDESFEVAYDHDVVISPTVIPYSEFESMKHDLPYYRNIMNEGVEISA
ncbi:MAG: nucleotidyltransferase domain-containing protein [bacterium]|nr:nucleotidyltransferase domain-containing protein [bacterium]